MKQKVREKQKNIKKLMLFFMLAGFVTSYINVSAAEGQEGAAGEARGQGTPVEVQGQGDPVELAPEAGAAAPTAPASYFGQFRSGAQKAWGTAKRHVSKAYGRATDYLAERFPDSAKRLADMRRSFNTKIMGPISESMGSLKGFLNNKLTELNNTYGQRIFTQEQRDQFNAMINRFQNQLTGFFGNIVEQQRPGAAGPEGARPRVVRGSRTTKQEPAEQEEEWFEMKEMGTR